jgi:dephospho-CoA kinase
MSDTVDESTPGPSWQSPDEVARILSSLPGPAIWIAITPPPETPDVADQVLADLATLRAQEQVEAAEQVTAAEVAAVAEALASPPRPPPVPPIDPGVELHADQPIMRLEADALARKAVAQRLVELATAAPMAQPRVVGLTGGSGTGKSSVLAMASEILRDHPEVSFVDLDAVGFVTAAELGRALVAELTEFFGKAGVVDTSDKVRDALSRYGGIVSDIAKVVGVKVDLAGAVKRSNNQVLAEIAEMTQEVGRRLVVVIDHVDRLPMKEFIAVLELLRHYAVIAYVTIVVAVDRRGIALRSGKGGELDPSLIERLINVELRLPAADPALLAFMVLDGLDRLGQRLGRPMDAIRALFDPEHADGGPGLALIESPRDAKRVINALTAELPLAADGELREVALDTILRLLVPELDGSRLDHRSFASGHERGMLLAELEGAVEGHRRAGGARAALRALFAKPAG